MPIKKTADWRSLLGLALGFKVWNHLSKDLPVAPGVKSALFPIEAVYIPVEQREIVLAEYRESGLFNYYGSIKQGGNIYDVVVPKTITVYFENKNMTVPNTQKSASLSLAGGLATRTAIKWLSVN